MKIKMTETVQGSLDGESVRELVKGREYDTVGSPRGDRLANYHVDQGVAVHVSADAPAPADTLAGKPVAKKAK